MYAFPFYPLLFYPLLSLVRVTSWSSVVMGEVMKEADASYSITCILSEGT